MNRLFWAKVAVGDEDACWPWLMAKDPNGYGHTSEDGGQRKAHRVAWERMNGKIPDDMHVCHCCDNRACCNPAHLFLGSALTNMRDKIAKGRARYVVPRGERNGLAKIADVEIPVIRTMHLNGMRQTAIARLYGVHPSTVNSIVRGKHRTGTGFLMISGTA